MHPPFIPSAIHWENHSDISIPNQITEVLIEAGQVKIESTWHKATVSYMSWVNLFKFEHKCWDMS